VSSALDINGDFLFLNSIETMDFLRFQSRSFFGPSFGPFHNHLASHRRPEVRGGQPAYGVLPGVIVLETMAQTAAFALGIIFGCPAGTFLLKRADVLFGSVARPGEIRCSAVFAPDETPTESFELKAYQEDSVIARGRLTYGRQRAKRKPSLND